ncbi:hypothetical protein [Streptosporangium sp. NPDC002524]|uniref:hypothetical protein n=1 Tax=Streptosporangium sp. NPDC002524 TaxID=3154537 RepID=UPI00331B3A08
MIPNRKPDRYVPHWETLAVTALPTGWRNLYIDEGITSSPCPAILVQERRADTHCWDIDLPDGSRDVKLKVVPCKQPYETRTVFADFDMANLEAADDVGNYLRTIGPGEDIPESTDA